MVSSGIPGRPQVTNSRTQVFSSSGLLSCSAGILSGRNTVTFHFHEDGFSVSIIFAIFTYRFTTLYLVEKKITKSFSETVS